MRKWAYGLGRLMAFALAVLWLNRDSLLMGLPGMIDGLRNPIASHRQINWSP